MKRKKAHTKNSFLARIFNRSKYLLTASSLVISLLSGITVGAAPANAVLTNPTPVCSGATCIINFTSTNDYYAWSAPVAGTYTFEVWGGQGGTRSGGGGTGGYAKGDKVMTAGTTLYIYVGGQGVYSTGTGAAGYNGGGVSANSGEQQGGGGGATHIATAVGLLSTLSGNQASVLLVAGGGGGSDNASNGGVGGGTAGTNGTPHTSYQGRPGIGGTQTTAGCATNQTTTSTYRITCGAFGQGGTGANYYGAGGGGGWYGGGGGEYDSGGGGGSGYVGGVTSTTLTAGNATMPNPAGGTMTGRTGVGYARVTYPNGPAVTTFTSAQTTPTNTTSSISYSLTLSENVTGLANGDFNNAGTATGCTFSVSGSGSSYTLTVSSCSEGTLIPRLLATSVLGSSTSQNGPASDSLSSSTITIDRTAPSVSSITAPANATYTPAGQINFTANMSEAVLVTGTPRIALTIGSTTRYANYVSGSGTAALLFRYTVATDINDIDGDGIVSTSPIDLNGGTMADAATNTSARTFTPPSMTSVLVIQPPSAPTINAISASSGALSIAFTAGASNGSTITNYQYSLNGGVWTYRPTGTTASPIDITGLTNGIAYTVAIRAVNAAGAGTASTTSASVTVQAALGISGGGNISTNYGTSASVTFTSLYGSGTKSFSIKRTSDNNQVSGVTINSSTGVVTAGSSVLPGNYGMTVTVTDAANATASTTMTITINAASLTITAASPASISYGGTKAADTFTATGLNALDSVNALTYTYRGTGTTSYGPTTTPPTAAGTYSITPSGVGFVDAASAARYSTITYAVGLFTINKKALTVTPTAGQTISYGSIPSLTFSVSGFENSESASTAAGYSAPSCAVSTYSSSTSNAGSTHTVTCSGGSANNYTFTTTATAIATVSKASLTVIPDAKSVTYGDAAPTLTFGINGWMNSQSASTAAGYVAPTCSSSYTRTSVAGTPVTISCSGGSADNYTFNTATTASITIAKISTLTITAGSPSAINYGSATPANSYSASGLGANDVIATVAYKYAGTGSTTYSSSSTAPTLPGTYSITPEITSWTTGSASNYTTITYVAGLFTINAASLTITAASPASISYGGTKAADTFTATGLNALDSVNALTYTYRGTGTTSYGPTTTPPTAAGTYSITPSGVGFVDAASAARYSTITYAVGLFTINKKALTVTPTAGQTISYGSIPSLTFSVSGFENSESASTAAGYSAPSCAVSTYSSSTSNAGSTHTVTCSGGSANNYTFTTTATAIATVSKASLTVIPDAKSVTYGDAAPTLTFGINGWMNSQSASTAAGYVAPTCSSSYTRTSVAGTPVTISCSGGSADNYTFNTATTASITIAKISTLTITAGSPSAINYGSATPANSYSASGLGANDVIATVAYKYAGTGSTTYSSSSTAPTLPGTYSITPEITSWTTGSASNYTTITYVAGLYRVNGGNLQIIASNQLGVTYGSSIPETFTAVGLAAGDAVQSLTYTYRGTGTTSYGPTTTPPTNVGTYSLFPSAVQFTISGVENKYTSISYQVGLITIVKAPLQIVPSSVSVVYGNVLSGLGFTVTGLQYSESLASISGYVAPTCTSTYTTSTQVALSPVSVTCSGGSANNYTFVTGTSNSVTITKRPLIVTGTTIATRPYNGTTAPGTITIGTVNGLATGESLPITATAANYSSESVGTYTTTVTYSLSNNADSSKGLANNYTISTSSVSAQVVSAEPGFNVSLSQGATTAFSINYGSSETLTITATTATSGSVNFKVSINGGSSTDISGCASITITSGAAVCPWANPTTGKVRITITLTPTNANEAVDTKIIDTVVVARPYITSFQVRGQSGVTSGPAGTVVVITGGNFTGITDIKFNGISAEKTFRATATQATVTVPFGASTGKISITTLLGGTGTSSGNFTVTG